MRPTPSDGADSPAALRPLFLLFFVSGFCGLLYQVVWLRLAFAAFGVVTPVLSVVLSVFMLGLALGTWLGGRWVGPLTRRTGASAITLYAGVECLIGLGAVAVPHLFDWGQAHLLPQGAIDSTRYLGVSGIAITLAILPWAAAMGATFPLMMAFAREVGRHQQSFSFLYLANVAGAACGTLVTALVLVELLGFRSTLMVAGFANFSVAVWAITFGRALSRSPRVGAVDRTPPLASGPWPTAPSTIDALLFITGFASMAMEVVWTRAFTPYLETTIYAFAGLLATYLVATAIGSRRYRAHVTTGTVVAPSALIFQLAVAVCLPVILTDPRLHPRSVTVLASIVPFSYLLGYLTPQLIDRRAAGRPGDAGAAYAVNIVGGILGPLGAGYLLLPHAGVRVSLVVLAAPFLIMMIARLGTAEHSARWKRSCAGLALLLAVCALTINVSFEDRQAADGGIVRRDATATVIAAGTGLGKQLYVNGIGITSQTSITKVMAHLPLLSLSHAPVRALAICFGMGTTFRSLASWHVDTTAVELVPSVRDMFGFFFSDAKALSANPQARIVVDDGRRFLTRTAESFDVITIDPPPPITAAGSSLLYSTEFYRTARQRLRPGGILQQWFFGSGPTPSRWEQDLLAAVARSLQQVFPHIRVYRSFEGWGYHFLASDAPIALLTPEEAERRLPDAARQDLLEWLPGTTAHEFLSQVLARPIAIEKLLLVDDPRWAITDDAPLNEYYLLRRRWDGLAPRR